MLKPALALVSMKMTWRSLDLASPSSIDTCLHGSSYDRPLPRLRAQPQTTGQQHAAVVRRYEDKHQPSSRRQEAAA